MINKLLMAFAVTLILITAIAFGEVEYTTLEGLDASYKVSIDRGIVGIENMWRNTTTDYQNLTYGNRKAARNLRLDPADLEDYHTMKPELTVDLDSIEKAGLFADLAKEQSSYARDNDVVLGTSIARKISGKDALISEAQGAQNFRLGSYIIVTMLMDSRDCITIMFELPVSPSIDRCLDSIKIESI